MFGCVDVDRGGGRKAGRAGCHGLIARAQAPPRRCGATGQGLQMRSTGGASGPAPRSATPFGLGHPIWAALRRSFRESRRHVPASRSQMRLKWTARARAWFVCGPDRLPRWPQLVRGSTPGTGAWEDSGAHPVAQPARRIRVCRGTQAHMRVTRGLHENSAMVGLPALFRGRAACVRHSRHSHRSRIN